MWDFALALVIIFAFLFKSYTFQSWLASQLGWYMSNELDVVVRIDKVEIDIFNRVYLKGVYIEDREGDTLIYANEVKCSISDYKIFGDKRFVNFKDITLVSPRIKLAKYNGSDDLNIDFLVDYFDSGPRDPKKKRNPVAVYCEKVNIIAGYISMDDYNEKRSRFGVDFDHLGLYPVNVSLSKFRNLGDTNVCRIQNLSFRERSGFVLDTLNADLRVAPDGMVFNNLVLKTPQSRIQTKALEFRFSDFDDFDDFENLVYLKSDFDSSYLSMHDLSFFVDELENSKQVYFLDGLYKGTVNNFELKNFTFAYSDRTKFIGSAKIKNITDTDKAFFDVDIESIYLFKADADTFQVPPYDGKTFIDLPKEVQRMGNIWVTGKFKGYLHDFKANVNLVSTNGTANADLTYRFDKVQDKFFASGHVVSLGFDVGSIIDEKDLGQVTANLDLTASGHKLNESMDLKLRGSIGAVEYKGYTYHNGTINGTMRNQVFNGDIDIKDELAELHFKGKLDLSSRVPRYDFTAKVTNAYIDKIHLVDRDESSKLSMHITAKGQGDNLDNLRGDVFIHDLHYSENGKELKLHMDTLRAKENPDKTKLLEFKSELADISFQGNFNFAELPNSFMYVLSKAMPSMFDNKVITLKNDQEFAYDVNLKNIDPITEIFVPDLVLSHHTEFSGRFNSKTNLFRLKSKNIEQLGWEGRIMNDVIINTKNVDDYLEITVKSEDFALSDSISLENFVTVATVYQNKFVSTVNWFNNDSLHTGDIDLSGEVFSHTKLAFELAQSSNIQLKEGKWTTKSNAHFVIDSTYMSVEDFEVYNGKQSISINGAISQNPADQLVASVCDFDLAAISPLLNLKDVHIRGELNGNLVLTNIYNTPDFKNYIAIDSFYVNDEWLGTFELNNNFSEGLQESKLDDRIATYGKLVRKDKTNFEVTGSYFIYNQKEGRLEARGLMDALFNELPKGKIDYTIKMDETNLQFINAFLPPDISNFNSLANGSLGITGYANNPKLKGKIKLSNGSVKINMLNVSYFFENGVVTIAEDMIALDNLHIEDVRGNSGSVNGTFYHENFENGNYNFDIDFNKLLCLNTTEDMNPLYYGKAYATGNMSISGQGDNMFIEIHRAKTERGTKLVLPTYSTEDITLGNFVTFESHDSLYKPDPINLSGITMKFNMEITPDAEISIVFDKIAGDQLRARGRGNLLMEIDPSGDFRMTGPFVVEQGDYMFTLKGIVKKYFTVAKGSTINWYGDPLAAEIDIKAVYKQSTTLYDIMPADIAANYKKNVDVETIMQLKGNLFNPLIGFDIRVPKADENAKSVLNSIKATEQELNKQVFSLLIINKFLPPSTGIGTSNESSNTNIAANYTSELLTNQLNSMLSQISDDFDIGLNYKPGDNISNQEIAVALSTQSKSGRLILSGNFGVSQATGANQNPSNIIGDFNIEYLINTEGTFRVRGFNESNEFDITRINQSPYTQGVGLFYQKEFDNARELRSVQRFFNLFRKKQNKVKFDENGRPIKNNTTPINPNNPVYP